jgi:GABA permease
MAAHVLVVATVTAASDDLLAALGERVRSASVPVDFLLVMPTTGPPAEAMAPRLEEALERWREAGLKAEGVIGDSDPVQAVAEVWKPGRFDEVIVSTLPGQTSRWLRWDVPYRIGALTDLPVRHVVAMSMVKPAHRGEPLPRRERAPLGLLNVMAYRGNHPV